MANGKRTYYNREFQENCNLWFTIIIFSIINYSYVHIATQKGAGDRRLHAATITFTERNLFELLLCGSASKHKKWHQLCSQNLPST